MELLDHDIQEVDQKNYLEKLITSPRKAFRFLQHNQYDKYTYLLIVLASLAGAFQRAYDDHHADQFSFGIVVLLAVATGLLLGWLTFYVSSWLLHYGGLLLDEKAKGTQPDLLRVVAHAALPTIIGIGPLLFLMVMYGEKFYTSRFGFGSELERFLEMAYGITTFILGLWTIVLSVIGISEVQGFSVWRAIANLILPAILIVLAIFAIVALFGMLGALLNFG